MSSNGFLADQNKYLFEMASSSSVHKQASNSPFAFCCPFPNLPSAGPQVMWSLPTLALKSPSRISLSDAGTLMKASFSSSGYVIVGAYIFMSMMWRLAAKRILRVMILSDTPLGCSVIVRQPNPDSGPYLVLSITFFFYGLCFLRHCR